jgi:transcriptional regulator with XRE-family HTH domain
MWEIMTPMAGPNTQRSWDLGLPLREARQARGLTQTSAAERAGISRTVWQQLESGERSDGRPVRPKSSTVINVAAAVGMDPREALKLAGLDPSGNEPVRAGRPVTSVAEVRDLLARLREPQRRAIIDLVRAFVEDLPAEPEPPAEPFRQGTTVSEPERRRPPTRRPRN